MKGSRIKGGFCKRFLQVFEPYIKIRELCHEDDRAAKTSFMDVINTFGAVSGPHGSNALFDHIEKAKHVASRKKKSAIEIPTDQEFPDEAASSWVKPGEEVGLWADQQEGATQKVLLRRRKDRKIAL